jgi:hypothetical protein
MKNACPCCGYLTLEEPAADEICPVCYWHDDGQTEAKAAEVWGGPNGTLDLLEARANFRKFGAVEKRFVPHVRSPRPEELHV